MVLQVLVVPLLAGISGRGVKRLTWASCIIALVGVGLLEEGGAPPSIGDFWNLLSALFFGLQVSSCMLHRTVQVTWTCHSLKQASVLQGLE